MLSLIAGSACGLGAFLIVRNAIADQSAPVIGAVRRRLLASGYEDRKILGITDELFVARLLAGMVGGVCAAALMVLVVVGIGIRMATPLLLILIGCGAVLPVGLTFERNAKQAAAARRTFSYALSSYLDLASVLLAGGAGGETALNAVASTGKSWSFRLIREALEGTRAARQPSWRAFGDLGKDLGIVDLERLAGSMQLAGEQGAKVRTSLAAQADALRARQIAEIEAEAQAATERMGVPTVLLFVGFIALLGYPALDLVVGRM